MIYAVFIITLLVVSFPLQILLGILIVAGSGSPIFFRQKRIGKNGKPFMLYKFRTMVTDADGLKARYQKLNQADGPVFKIHSDPRFTPIGRFLSHTGLDELPQIWNVVRGDMALIGPRPLPVSESKKLASWMKERYAVKPGIISPWILEGYHRQSFDAWMKSDIAYAKSKHALGDFLLLIRTIRFLIALFWKEISIV